MTARRWLFLVAYVSSGLAGLVYEVSWTRLLTLYMGHTTAATSTVVAAFMGGLAGGAVLAGRFAARLTLRQCLQTYIVLECAVAAIALLLPFELAALTPLLAWAYQDGAPGALFPLIRLIACLALMFIPAAALGATFPLAVRWFAGSVASDDAAASGAGRLGGTLYALNTAGAAVGALAAGFVLIPAVGVWGTTFVGVGAGVLAVAAVALLLRTDAGVVGPSFSSGADRGGESKPRKQRARDTRARAQASDQSRADEPNGLWLAATVLGLSGCASLMFEIAWARVLALTLGPTTYAFATTVAALIAGLACGSGAGAWAAGRTRRPALWLSLALTGAAVAASIACGLAGGEVPRRVAEQVASAPESFDRMLARAAVLAAILVFPTAVGLGAAFPLALALVGQASSSIASRVGVVYAVNTVAAVGGSLAAGFLTIPLVGLQQTLRLVTALLILSGFAAAFWGRLSTAARTVSLVASAAAALIFAISPPWDHELLASGVYKYSAYVAKGLDLEAALKAGTLLYYREGAASTVTVKRLTGTVTLAIDGKVDASNQSDMLTQKLIAHLPLLLHENPREVCIIGVGSGVTLAAALTHPVARVDVVEISPEVVEAARFFADENRGALMDPRTRLIVGDGRSHLALSKRIYDAIISEPSNPWIAGVAALFTREFFLAARDRLAPGGIISQWAHTYNISAGDLRSIVATFTSVFPNGTIWMVGQDDVLLVATNDPLDARIATIDRAWQRPGVANDLRGVSAVEPFAIWSLFAGGPQELREYSAGAALQTDDRMGLEFSGPRAMDNRGASENAASLRGLLPPRGGPPVVREALAAATPAQWRARAAMMLRADVPSIAHDDYLRALAIDPTDAAALDGFSRTAVLTGRVAEALDQVKAWAATHPQVPSIWVAKSKLLAASGAVGDALEAAKQASEIKPVQVVALEQIASLFGSMGDAGQLDVIVQKLQQMAPDHAATSYHAAVSKFLHGEFAEVVQLGQRTVAADPQYAAIYDVIGAAHLKLGQPGPARDAFHTSLRFNPHDSTAYTNLGILELAAGNRADAARHFAEALWLDPESTTARDGLTQARR